jgi:hypothetical protein
MVMEYHGKVMEFEVVDKVGAVSISFPLPILQMPFKSPQNPSIILFPKLISQENAPVTCC